MKLKTTRPKLLLLLGATLIFITLISVFNPFKFDLFAADNPAACYNACTSALGEGYDSDCQMFCYPEDYFYYYGAQDCAELSESFGHTEVARWCSFIGTNQEVCTGACMAENYSFSDYQDNCAYTCQMYSTTQGCIENAEGLIGTGADTTFCSYLDYTTGENYL